MRIAICAALVALVLGTTVVSADAACDAAGADAAAVVAGREAIDAACPCAAAVSRASYRRCATLEVRARVAANQLSTACRRDVLRHAKLSICGRPGAAVCCRVRADGRTRHGVVSNPASCVDTATFLSCVSTWQSVPLGCDAAGCVPPPVCGNGAVEAGEECDPPDRLYCNLACQQITCDLPPTACGNGVVDPGETCEPPGVGNCASDCQLATCSAPAAGVTAIACVPPADPSPYPPPAPVAAGASPSGYFIGWSGPHRRTEPDVLGRRFDADLAPVDGALTVVTDGAPCGAGHGSPAIGSDGAQYYVAWSSYGNLSDGGPPYETIDARRLGGVAGEQPIDQLAFNTPVGFCRTDIGGPTIVGGVSPDRFAVGYREVYSCPNGFIQHPLGRIVDFNPGAIVPTVTLGSLFGPVYSASSAGVAVLGGDVLWAWHIADETNFPPTETFGIAAVWTDATSSSAATLLTTEADVVRTPPGVAAGATSILVAWAQGNVPGATAATEVRVVRATRTDGNLDPDGGVLVATARNVTLGPLVAFDGSRWLLVWVDTDATNPFSVTSELRALAIAADGAVLDASPRLLATSVTSIATASVGDGRVLVVFGQPTGGRTAVRAMLVTP